MATVAVLDYGMGNLRSVEKAIERVGSCAFITRDPDRVRAADGVVLPGVGAFPTAMERVRRLGLAALVAERIEASVPVLGICLGMQLLFDRSAEARGAEGLGFLAGDVEPLPAEGLKIPHIGWSPVRWERSSPLTDGIDSEAPFYFVHSFAPRPGEPADIVGTARYGERFTCAVERPPLYGVQFHPEKSGPVGLRLLANFAKICAPVAA